MPPHHRSGRLPGKEFAGSEEGKLGHVEGEEEGAELLGQGAVDSSGR